MASAATADPPLAEPRAPPSPPLGEDSTGNTATRRGRSRKRKSGETDSSEGHGKKRTFDNFFNFCSFVLAYEEQLERQARASSTNSTHPPDSPTPKEAVLPTNSTSTDDHMPSASHSSENTAAQSNGTPKSADPPPSPPPPQRDHTPITTSSPAHISAASTTSAGCSSSSESSESGEEERGRERGGPDAASSKDSSNEEQLEYTSEDESWNLVTCFCRRPFAGRPMIECSKCNTWVHLFCAKIRKSAVPDVYTCPKCLPRTSSTAGTRRSST